MKDISIIMINYNSASYSMNCVNSILNKTNSDLEYEIIIIDNNSNEQDYDRLNHFCKGVACVSLIRSRINLGFSAGHMLGVQKAQGSYIYFLNNDTEFLNDNLRILYSFMESNKSVALCTGQMYDSNKNFKPSFNSFPTLRRALFGASLLSIFNPRKYPSRKRAFTCPVQVDFATGAAMFVNFEKFAEVGGFDTNYFLYCEEEDIAMKFKQAGYSIFLIPEAKFIHHVSKSTIRDLRIEKEFYVSLFYYHKKYSGFLEYKIIKLLHFLKNVKRAYKGANYLKISLFILKGAKMGNSLRHGQKIALGDR